jgi:hypothetical protein
MKISRNISENKIILYCLETTWSLRPEYEAHRLHSSRCRRPVQAIRRPTIKVHSSRTSTADFNNACRFTLLHLHQHHKAQSERNRHNVFLPYCQYLRNNKLVMKKLLFRLYSVRILAPANDICSGFTLNEISK